MTVLISISGRIFEGVSVGIFGRKCVIFMRVLELA